MLFTPQWTALQREAQLAAEQIASGVTVLGRANHAQPGLYSQAFFGLSIGLERMGKLIFIADHAIMNGGAFPTNEDLKKGFGHDLQPLLARCETISKSIVADCDYAERPVDAIHQGIEDTLSEFAIGLRYYNLNYIAGAAGGQTDPIAMWWKKVAEPICDRHYTDRQRRNYTANATRMAEVLGKTMSVVHQTEDGNEIGDPAIFFARAGVTNVVQRYGRLYTLQIVRWLASIVSNLNLCHRGAYQGRIQSLLGLDEPFQIFLRGDRDLRDRKTWSIYR